MSLSNILSPNGYNLYANSVNAVNLVIDGTNFDYSTTTATNMKINHYNGASAQTDNISTVHFTKIGNVVYCRIPSFTTVNVQSGAAEDHFLYIWPIPEGYYNASGSISDVGLRYIEYPGATPSPADYTVDFRIEPNINDVNSGVVNQPGIAILRPYDRHTDNRVDWPATTHFQFGEPVTFSYMID